MNIPPYAVWFPTSGVLAAVAGFLIARDDNVMSAGRRNFEAALALLNEHLWGLAKLAAAVRLPSGVGYEPVRDQSTYEKLYELIAAAQRARLWPTLTRRLTKLLVSLVTLHVIGGIVATGLFLRNASGFDSTDSSVFISWAALSGITAFTIVCKALIFVTKGR